jgi:two-component system sensor histidine kinase BaeS
MMAPRLGSLRTRLFVAIALIVVLSVGVTLAVGALLTRRAVERATLDDVAHQADLLAERERAALLPLAHIGSLTPFLAKQDERVVTPSLAGPSQYLDANRTEQVRAGRPVQGTVHVGGTSYFYAARRVGDHAFVLLRPKRVGASDWMPYLEGLLIAGLVGAVLAALASFWMARVISRPVRRVAEASRDLAAGGSPEPVPLEGATELALLASSFNDMAAQLARAREAERSFLLSVSHELKTPLTSIRGYAEALVDGAVPVEDAAETIGREAGRLERLVQDLLDLARMNRSEFAVHVGAIDLADAAREAVLRHEPRARALGLTLEAVAPDQAPALGDADRILQVASNLVENALRLTPAGGAVRVVAAPGSLAVEDTGPGLRPDELPRAFERFFLYSRYGKERPVGTGLGLAIVKQLTEAMGGAVEVESDAELTRFIVRLRVPSPAPTRRGRELLRAS